MSSDRSTSVLWRGPTWIRLVGQPSLSLAISSRRFSGTHSCLQRGVRSVGRWRAALLGDRSFDHDNDTEREDGIHRMDAHIVADEETVKAADDPHMLDFRP